MKPKRTLTPEQEAARDARRQQFKTLWQRVAKMSDAERAELVNRAGAIVTCDGHPLSVKNTCLLFFQIPNVSIVGGFRQWLKHGRCVKKGEHGGQIYIPCGAAKQNDDGTTTAEAAEIFFSTATVFDISQTAELETDADSATATTENKEETAA